VQHLLCFLNFTWTCPLKVTLPSRATFTYLGYALLPDVTKSLCSHLYQLRSTISILSILVYPQSGYLFVYHMGLSLDHCGYLSIGSLQVMDPQPEIQPWRRAQAAGHDPYANEENTIPAHRQELVTTWISITTARETIKPIVPPSTISVKNKITVNAGVIHLAYTSEIKVLLINIGDQDYQILKGDRRAQLIPEMIVQSDSNEVPKWGRTLRGQQWFGNTGTSQARICQGEMNDKAFLKFYQRADTTRLVLKYNKNEAPICLESVNISSTRTIKRKKYAKKRHLNEMVPQEYHWYLDILAEEEETGIPPHHPRVDLEMKLTKEQGLPDKKWYPLSQDSLEELWNYCKQHKNPGGHKRPTSTEGALSCSSRKQTESFDHVSPTAHSTRLPRRTDTPTTHRGSLG